MGLTSYSQAINNTKINNACNEIKKIADDEYLAAENLINDAADIAANAEVFNYNGETLELYIRKIADEIKTTRANLKSYADTTIERANAQRDADIQEVDDYWAWWRSEQAKKTEPPTSASSYQGGI